MLQSKTRIGQLDRDVTFIQSIIIQGNSNEDKITDWEEIENYPTVSARKIENSGNTFVEADRITWSQQTTWQIRWRDDLNVRMRLVYNSQVYEILNIADLEEGRQRFLSVVTNMLDQEFFT